MLLTGRSDVERHLAIEKLKIAHISLLGLFGAQLLPHQMDRNRTILIGDRYACQISRQETEMLRDDEEACSDTGIEQSRLETVQCF